MTDTAEKPEKDLPPRGQESIPWWLGAVLWTVGTLSLVLGFAGVFLPLLPTTPFLLLAAACYVRVSPRAYRWLLRNRTLGPIIEQWRAERTVPARAKWTGVILVFVAFAASVILVPNCIYGYVTLFVLGSGLIVFLASLPTARTAIGTQVPPGA